MYIVKSIPTIAFQVLLLVAEILFSISFSGASINNSALRRNELDEICCPISTLTRSRTVGMLWNPNGPPQNVTYIYQGTIYKQILKETLCQFPDSNVPLDIRNSNARCDGRCKQIHGGQLMITLQHSPLSYILALIDIKIGCKFLSNNATSV